MSAAKETGNSLSWFTIADIMVCVLNIFWCVAVAGEEVGCFCQRWALADRLLLPAKERKSPHSKDTRWCFQQANRPPKRQRSSSPLSTETNSRPQEDKRQRITTMLPSHGRYIYHPWRDRASSMPGRAGRSSPCILASILNISHFGEGLGAASRRAESRMAGLRQSRGRPAAAGSVR